MHELTLISMHIGGIRAKMYWYILFRVILLLSLQDGRTHLMSVYVLHIHINQISHLLVYFQPWLAVPIIALD